MSRWPILFFIVGAAACGGAARSGAAPQEWVEPTTGMVFARIPDGRFVMGSPIGETGRGAQERQHDVSIAAPFYLGKFEVTQAQWRAMMGENPSWFSGDDKLPVERVNWHQVHAFLERLSAKSPGNRFRLPSEAEWEYACRAGTDTPYPWGSALTTAQANFDARPPGSASAKENDYRARTTRVGSFAPNAWGLLDMNGNVWEWTEDDYCDYPAAASTSEAARCGSGLQVIRGGSWRFGADSARCGLRYTHRPQDLGYSLGFRAVRVPAGAPQARGH